VKKTLGEATRFAYGVGGQLLAEYDAATGALRKQNAYGPGGLLASVVPNALAGAGTRYVTADHLGSPRAVTNSAGAVVARHDYKPFGEEVAAGTGGRTAAQGYVADNVRQKFTGYERDGETGLDFAQARYYASAQGRFTSVDPFRGSGIQSSPQSWNRYTYCLNNPLYYVDPSGMQWVHDTEEDLYIWVEDEDYKEGNEYFDNVDRYAPLSQEEIGPDGVTFTLTRGTYAERYSDLAGREVYLGADGKLHATESSQGPSDDFPVNPTKLFSAGVGYANTGRKLASGFLKLGVAFGVEGGSGLSATLPAVLVGAWGAWDLYGSTAAYNRANQQWNEAFNERWSDASWKNLYGPLPYGQRYDDPSEPGAAEFWPQQLKNWYQNPLEFIREIGSGLP
jgi:RHS repeat-associated protein